MHYHCHIIPFFIVISLCTQTEYIGSPDPTALYATPGLGNVSSDGVHPSTQGCKCAIICLFDAVS